MPPSEDMARPPGPEAAAPNGGSVRFLVLAAAWVLALFGVMRIPAVQQGLLMPLLSAQQQVARWHGAGGSAPVQVTLECSAADVTALCLAVTLAYPVAWRKRLIGAAGGLAVILALNTLRIGTLSATAGTPLFTPLHLYVWPAALVVATLCYVSLWMWSAGAGSRPRGPWLRFAAVAAVLVCSYLAASPVLTQSGLLQRVGGWVALTAGMALGPAAQAQGNLLLTRHGAFAVTAECILTPLMPLYLAAVITVPRRWSQRLVGVLAFFPLFALLAVGRLFTLALPPFVVRSPLFAVHAFHQLLLGALLVVAAAAWASRQQRRSFARGMALGALVAAATFVAGGAYNALLLLEARVLRVVLPHTLTSLSAGNDVQGALVLLPAYQIGLLAALWLAAGERRPRRLMAGLAALHAAQLLLLAGLGALATQGGMSSAVLLRAWAVAAPVATFWLLRPRPTWQPLPEPSLRPA